MRDELYHKGVIQEVLEQSWVLSLHRPSPLAAECGHFDTFSEWFSHPSAIILLLSLETGTRGNVWQNEEFHYPWKYGTGVCLWSLQCDINWGDTHRASLTNPVYVYPSYNRANLFVLCIRIQPSSILETFCLVLKPDLHVSYAEMVIFMHAFESFFHHMRIFLSSRGTASVHRSVITPSHRFSFYHKKLEPGSSVPWQRFYSTFSVRKVHFQYFFFQNWMYSSRCHSTEIINIIHFTSYVVT